MSKPNQIVVSVPQKCHENWAQMTPSQQGRHCNSCDKTVVDFTKFTDEELYRYFAYEKREVCGRYNSHQLNRPVVGANGWLRRSAAWIAGVVTSMFLPPLQAQNNADVEVIRLSGPGTEPVFKQWSDSMEFNFKLKSGLVANDPDLKYIKVEGDSFSLDFEKGANGEFDIYVPNVWNDSVYTFSFYDSTHYLLGRYAIPVKDAHKYLNAKIHIPTLPEATILKSRGLYLTGSGGGGVTMGISVSSCYGVNTIRRVQPISNLNGIYPVRIETKSEGKIPVHVPAKVEYGSQDLPGVNPFTKPEVPGG